MDGKQKMSIRWRAAAVACLALGGVGVAAAHVAAGHHATSGWAVLQDVAGDTVGFARLTEDDAGGMRVNVYTLGMGAGLHGIHVHTTGSCSSETGPFSGAGLHHNPTGALHGAHAGDLPNLVVGRFGLGYLHTTLAHFTLTDGPTSVFGGDGSALVVHAAEDDRKTDPSGGSGARIACGVIHAG